MKYRSLSQHYAIASRGPRYCKPTKVLYNTNTNFYNAAGTLQDDVAIFNAALTASEMNAVYNGNYNTSKLISLYRAEDNTNDSFGSNNASAPNGMGYSLTLHP